MVIALLGAHARLLWQALRAVPQVEPWLVFRQAFMLMNQSLLFVGATMAFVGAILVLLAADQLAYLISDLSMVGPVFLQLLVSEFGPTIVALLLAARYGAAVAAHIGTMAMTEQLDALRMAGANPIVYLVAPRVLAGVLCFVPMAVFGVAVAFGTGAWVASHAHGVGWDTYVNTRMTHIHDVAVGCTKALAYGVAVPTVAAFAGLRAHGGAPGVGRAATQAVIRASVAVLAIDLLVGALGYAWRETP